MALISFSTPTDRKKGSFDGTNLDSLSVGQWQFLVCTMAATRHSSLRITRERASGKRSRSRPRYLHRTNAIAASPILGTLSRVRLVPKPIFSAELSHWEQF